MGKAKGKGRKESGPKVAKEPSSQKRPSTGTIDPTASGGTSLVWRLARVDLKGTWGWSALDAAHIADLHAAMCEYEKSTPRILRQKQRLREIPPEDLVPGAQERLQTLEQDETSGLTELRLGRRKWRVWGFLSGSVFDVLWWDPEHTVCKGTPRGRPKR